MKGKDIVIVYPPIEKTFEELMEEFRNLDKYEIYEIITTLRKVRDDYLKLETVE